MSGPWLQCLAQAQKPAFTLVCLPWAGGGVIGYRPLKVHHPADVSLWAIAPPGREQRLTEPPEADFHRWIEAIGRELRNFPRPLVLFGHSFGAILSFELAHWLKRHGGAAVTQEEYLGSSQSVSTSMGQGANIEGMDESHSNRAEKHPGGTASAAFPHPALVCVSSRRPPKHPSPIPSLADSPDEQLVAWMHRLGGVEAELLANAEMLDLILPPLRNDMRLDAAYRPRWGALDLPILAFAGRKDPLVSVDEVCGWRQWTKGAFTSCILPGGHFHLHDRPGWIFDSIRKVIDGEADPCPPI